MNFIIRARISSLFLLFILVNNIIGNELNIEDIYKSSKLSFQEKYDSINTSCFSKTTPLEQLFYSNILINLALEDNNKDWCFLSYFFKANAYYYLANPEKACEHYLKSLDALPKTSIENKPYSVYMGLGNAYSMSVDHNKSIFYYLKALENIHDNNFNYYGYTLLNIVDEFLKMNLIDSADFYLQKTDSIFNTLNDNIGTAYVLGNKAIICSQKEECNHAEYFFHLADSILHEEGNIYAVLSFQIELAKAYIKKDEYQLALTKLTEGYKKSQTFGYRELARDFSRLLSETYSKLGNYQQAWFYEHTYNNLNDSIINESSIRKIADLRTEYEVSQKQLEIDLLERERFTNRIIIAAISFVSVALFIFLYLLYKNFKLVSQQGKQLEEQKQDLQELVQTKDKMFSIISHDLRGPLHSLSSLSSLMNEVIEFNSKEEMMIIGQSMDKSLKSVTSLLDNLLEWSMQEQGHTPYSPSKFNPQEVFEELLEIFENSAMAKEIKIYNEIENCPQIFADKNTFSTIFRNLIGNAIKFTDKGGTIKICCTKIQNRQVFAVSDTGIGIAEDKLKNIFTLKEFKNSYGTANEKGTGLGLHLAYEFVKLNKGTISVESEVGKGTTFFVEFPV